jgi:hypothetical protein
MVAGSLAAAATCVLGLAASSPPPPSLSLPVFLGVLSASSLDDGRYDASAQTAVDTTAASSRVAAVCASPL